MKLVSLLSAVLLSAVAAPTLSAQCQRGRHPAGVTSVPGAGPGCNDIDGTGLPAWFSMYQAPSASAGGLLRFSILDAPSAGVRPAFAVGTMAISTRVLTPGIHVPGTGAACIFNVYPDGLFSVIVPMWAPCYALYLTTLPPAPWLVGFSFYSQIIAEDLTNNKIMVTNPIRVTFQP